MSLRVVEVEIPLRLSEVEVVVPWRALVLVRSEFKVHREVEVQWGRG